MIRFSCSSCQRVLSAPDNKAGVKVACPGCKNVVTVPQASSPTAQAVSASPPAPAPAPMPGTQGTWLYTSGGQRRGPVSFQELQQLAASAQLKPSDSVWTKGMPKAQPASQVEGLFSADGKPVAAPAAAAAKTPAWKRFLAETKQIAIATGVQSIRPLRFGRNVIRGRSLRRNAEDAQLNLGQKLYEHQLGDGQLRKHIHDLGEQAHAVNVSKTDAARLVKERKQSLCELAAPAMAGEAPPTGVELEHGHARETQARLATYREQMQADRLLLFPGDAVAWRRVGIGYGAAACVGLLALVIVWSSSGTTSADESTLASNTTENATPKRELKPMNTEQIYAASAKSVCLIKSENGFGTGFMIRPGVIATNAHVLGLTPIDKFRVTFPSAGAAGATRLKPQLVYFDSKRDLAFLKIDSKIDPLYIADEYEFRPGRDITVIGNPGIGSDSLTNAVSKGAMSTTKTIRDQKFYQLDLSVNPGNSGGPVFDHMGQVIGVITLKASEEERISFCIPLEDLQKAIATVDQQKPEDALRAVARYHYEMVFVREVVVGEIYSAVLSDFVKGFLEAIRNRRNPNQVFADHQIEMRKVRDFESEVYRDVAPFRDKIKTDPNLPAKLRDDLKQLLDNIEAMKKQAAATSIQVNNLDANVRRMRDQHRRIYEGIRDELGMDKDELKSQLRRMFLTLSPD